MLIFGFFDSSRNENNKYAASLNKIIALVMDGNLELSLMGVLTVLLQPCPRLVGVRGDNAF